MYGRLLAGLLLTTTGGISAAPAYASTTDHASQETGERSAARRTVFLNLKLSPAIVPGEKVSATGQMSTRLSRTVRLQLSTPKGWATVGQVRTDRRGGFAVADTGSRTGTYRVAVPKAHRYKAASSAAVAVDVAHELTAPQVLLAGQSITSPGGKYDLLLTPDGNLMVTPHGVIAPVWSTNTGGHPGARAVMQDRGQLVVVDAANNLLWQTGTTGAGARFQVRDDGTAAVVLGTTDLWTSTNGLLQAPTPAPTPSPTPTPTPVAGDAAAMFARAQSWVDAKVKYSQSKWYTNSYGRYRQDCSGFVSLAWGLGYSYTTRTLGGLSHQISKAQLAPGDILLAYNRHVVLFGGWTDASQTSYWGYEETPSTRATYRKIPYPYFSHKKSYLPYHKN